MSSNRLTSIILPVYNCLEAFSSGIPALIEYLKDSKIKAEIIVVDDGSTAGEAIESICAVFNVQYLKNKSNLGKGASVKHGVLASTGNLVLFMDGDFPFQLDIIQRMIFEMDQKDTDIVIGDRNNRLSQYPANLPVGRRIASSLLSLSLRWIGIKEIRDTQCGVKCFRLSVAKQLFGSLRETGFGFDIEILSSALAQGFHIIKLPVSVKEQSKTSVKLLSDGFKTFKLMLRLYREHVN